MVDPNPGMGASRELNEYYLTGEGSDWQESPHPWRTLRGRLLRYMSIEKADGLATRYYVAHFGFGPTSKEARRLHGGK
ncbi:hypothetical protein [Nocardia africana]